MGDDACVTCGSLTDGFKCEECGAEAEFHDEEHECGGEHCMPKCSGCGEPEVKCSCDEM